MKRQNLLVAGLAALALALLAPGRARAQEFSVGAYGSVDYEAARTVYRDGTPSTTENGFRVPTMDVFFRGSSGNWSFLSEVLLDIDEGNAFSVDVDRLQVSYEFGEWLKVTGGRFHSSFGYYNTAYPHGGAVYLLPIDRPEIVDQHDNRAILPTSSVGLNLHGRLPFARQRFSYDVDITNGQFDQADEVTNGGDGNNAKMLNLRLRYEFEGLIIGGNAMVDWIPPRLDSVPPQPDTLRTQVFGAHIAYVEHPWHVIGEAYVIQHISTTQTQRTVAGVAELGYTLGLLTPYARYEFARFPSEKDVFWQPTHQQDRGNYDAVSAGVKLVPNENFAIKFELEVNHAQTDTEYRAATQVAFGF